jgi:DnaJ-class molecular chaperone
MSSTTKWTELPHPFTNQGEDCQDCSGWGCTFEPIGLGFCSPCERCDGTGLEPVALEMVAD